MNKSLMITYNGQIIYCTIKTKIANAFGIILRTCTIFNRETFLNSHHLFIF